MKNTYKTFTEWLGYYRGMNITSVEYYTDLPPVDLYEGRIVYVKKNLITQHILTNRLKGEYYSDGITWQLIFF